MPTKKKTAKVTKKVAKKVTKKKVAKKVTKKKVEKKSEEVSPSEGLVVKTVEAKPATKVKGPAGVKSAKGDATVVVAKEDSSTKSTGKNVVFMGGKAVMVDDNDDSLLN